MTCFELCLYIYTQLQLYIYIYVYVDRYGGDQRELEHELGSELDSVVGYKLFKTDGQWT